jgi:ADP-ribosyl-[dinitrogen reductase] hydrolase
MTPLERFRGCLLGLAVADAVGTTLEFQPPGSFTPIQDMVGGGPFALQPGQWTDDTSMALCLATSLVEKQGFDPVDQMTRYVAWYQEGYLSSTGRCFDIGGATRAALHRFMATGEPYSGDDDPRSAGNGSLMRLAPVPMAFAGDETTAVSFAAASSRTTHAALEAVDACRWYTAVIIRALQGQDKASILHPDPFPHAPLAPAIEAIRQHSYQQKAPPEISGSGYVVRSLEAALWAFHQSDNYRDGCLLAANLGDDADTTAAIYGQLAGAYYGLSGIPQSWQQKVSHYDQIITLADQLWHLSTLLTPPKR